MNNKILVTIVVPMIEEEYDVYIPVSKPVSRAIKLIVKTVNELSDGYFPLKTSVVLLKNNGDVLAKSQTIKENGIKNNDRLILI